MYIHKKIKETFIEQKSTARVGGPLGTCSYRTSSRAVQEKYIFLFFIGTPALLASHTKWLSLSIIVVAWPMETFRKRDSTKPRKQYSSINFHGGPVKVTTKIHSYLKDIIDTMNYEVKKLTDTS